jgi:hypothetical protein
MSLINDALKQARKAPPRNVPSALPPLPPAEESWSLPGWFMPAMVVFLIIAVIFFIGWASAHHSVRKVAQVPPETVESPPPVAADPPTAAKPPPADASPPAMNPADAPKLQGIFYSPTDPSAIIDGKTVRLGDQFRQYHVKAISKYTVTLVGPDHKEFKIGMEN